jgi:hypothetical protein
MVQSPILLTSEKTGYRFEHGKDGKNVERRLSNFQKIVIDAEALSSSVYPGEASSRDVAFKVW